MHQHHLESFAPARCAPASRIAMGTDVGGYGYGDNGLELVLHGRGGHDAGPGHRGQHPALGGVHGDRRRGRHAHRGKEADLLVLDADPLADISVLREAKHRALVMKGGAAVTGSLAPALAPAAP